MTCRACGSEEVQPFVDLGCQPMSNDFRASNVAQPQWPLEMLVCAACGLGQLSLELEPEAVFNNTYAYFSSTSPTWVEDRRHLANRMINMFNLDQKSVVVEIGGNDGYYLKHFLGKTRVENWEPCANVAEVAKEADIPTVVKFWGPYAYTAGADLINATNVLAHTPDMLGMIAGIAMALKPDGVATLEFPLFTNLIRQNQIDTIYHEHYSYISLTALNKVLVRNDLKMWRVEELPTHGGSVRVFVSKQGSRFQLEDSVVQVAGQEIWPVNVDMQAKATMIKEGFWNWLTSAQKPIYGYGAPAKATVLCNYLGLGKDDIEFIVDDSPAKQGKLVPGTNIPVVSFDHLTQAVRPRNIVIFPWNLAEPIKKKLVDFYNPLSASPYSLGPDYVTAIPQLTKI
jgi:SAM-dependent methyltransferase